MGRPLNSGCRNDGRGRTRGIPKKKNRNEKDEGRSRRRPGRRSVAGRCDRGQTPSRTQRRL